MAPRKKAEETTTKPSPTPATRRSARMTRSAAKRLNARLTELPTDARKKRKQGKAEESKKKVKIETETVTATSTEAQAEVNTLEEEEEDDEDEDEDEANEEDANEESTCAGDGVNKTIVIEHCKQCDAFKTRAMQVKDGLLSAFPATRCCLILRRYFC
uniref:SepR n=1 Tax=Populus tomentosa TaxID=118781 RepID=A0A161CB19_POPTO|nr:SepR [Populus tomentosa]